MQVVGVTEDHGDERVRWRRVIRCSDSKREQVAAAATAAPDDDNVVVVIVFWIKCI